MAFRAAMQSDVLAATCCYAIDIHKRSLGAGMHDNSLDRIGGQDLLRHGAGVVHTHIVEELGPVLLAPLLCDKGLR